MDGDVKVQDVGVAKMNAFPVEPLITKEQIAELCHEVNRAYCKITGDTSQVPWDEAPEWQKKSAIAGVEGVFETPLYAQRSPSKSHNNWMKMKLEEGWRYGPVKDVEKKIHPCLLPYEFLSLKEQFKDVLFEIIVTACRGVLFQNSTMKKIADTVAQADSGMPRVPGLHAVDNL